MKAEVWLPISSTMSTSGLPDSSAASSQKAGNMPWADGILVRASRWP
jgi:hypothetical protein